MDRFSEKLVETSPGQIDVTTDDGSVVHFEWNNRGAASHALTNHVTRITNPHGLVTVLEYSNDKAQLLTKVTEPAGRTLSFEYQRSIPSGRWNDFGTVTQSPAAGQWLEITVPEKLKKRNYRHFRALTPAGGALAIVEIQYSAVGGGYPLAGKATDSGLNPEGAFDGLVGTSFLGARREGNHSQPSHGEAGDCISR